MKRWKGVVAPAIVAAAGVVFSCTSLPDIAPSVCGNRVVDLETEDCDEATVGGAGDAAPGTRRCGAPGTPAQCRILCATSAECNTGWSCGLDGLCREPRGTFATATPLTAEADDVALDDFDGDGVGDIVSWKTPDHPFERRTGNDRAEAPARLSIHYGEASGEIKDVYQLHISNVSTLLGLHPAFGHITTDTARSDVALSLRGGTSLFHGQADRTLLPILNPSFAVPDLGLHPMILDATGTSPGSEVLLYQQKDMSTAGRLLGDPNAPVAALMALDPNTGAPSMTARFAVFPKPAKLVTTFTGRFHKTGGPACDEMAFAFLGESRVAIVTPCNGNQLNTCEPRVVGGNLTCDLAIPIRYIDLPPPYRIAPEGMKFGDFDGDAHLDVLIAAGEPISDGKFLEVKECIAAGTPNGRFKGLIEGRCVRPEPGAVLPLAFGQVTNGDSAVDVVMPGFIALRASTAALPGPVDAGADATIDASSGPPADPLTTIVAAPPNVTWTEAHIVDINGDGLLDIVAGGATGIDVYGGTGDRLLNHARYAAAGGADLLTFSDYDGDGAIDIAFRQPGVSRPDGEREADTISILFGRLRSVPENPIPLGRLRGVEDLSAGVIGASLFGLEPDGLGDLGIVTKSAGGEQVTVMSGAVDRRIVSAFQLGSQRANGPPDLALANRYAIGRFTRDAKSFNDPHDDLAILTSTISVAGSEALPVLKSDYGLWLAALVEDGSLDQRRVSSDGHFLGTTSAAKQGEIEGDAFWPLTSMLALDLDKHEADKTQELDEIVILTQGLAGKTPWMLRTFEAKTDDKATPVGAERDAPREVGAKPTTSTGAFRTFAMDVDPKDPKDDADDLVLFLREGDTPTLKVFLNRRTGKLDPTPITFTATNGKLFVDAAPIRAHAPNPEIALLAKDGVYLARVVGTAIVVDPVPLVVVENATRIAVGDVSGDRIDDIVLVSNKGIQVFRGEARLK